MLPVSLTGTNQMPQLPESLMAMFRADAEQDWAGLGSTSVRRLKVGKMGFTVGSGQDAQEYGPNDLAGVCIATAPHNHCVWYERDYAPGMEPAQPDLIWEQKTDGYICPALPQQFHKKVVRNGAERWAFQTLRRTVWAFFKNDPNGQMMLDLDNPVVFDITSANLYGKSYPDQNLYKWSGLIALCKRMSVNGMVITPAMFPTQILIDGKMSIGGVVVFRPALASNGYPTFLDVESIKAIRAKRTTPEVQEMLAIREKLEYGQGAQDETPAPAPRPIQPQPIPQPAPASQAPDNLLAQAQQALASPQPVPQPTPAPAPQSQGNMVFDINAIQAMLAKARS